MEIIHDDGLEADFLCFKVVYETIEAKMMLVNVLKTKGIEHVGTYERNNIMYACFRIRA